MKLNKIISMAFMIMGSSFLTPTFVEAQTRQAAKPKTTQKTVQSKPLSQEEQTRRDMRLNRKFAPETDSLVQVAKNKASAAKNANKINGGVQMPPKEKTAPVVAQNKVSGDTSGATTTLMRDELIKTYLEDHPEMVPYNVDLPGIYLEDKRYERIAQFWDKKNVVSVFYKASDAMAAPGDPRIDRGLERQETFVANPKTHVVSRAGKISDGFAIHSGAGIQMGFMFDYLGKTITEMGHSYRHDKKPVISFARGEIFEINNTIKMPTTQSVIKAGDAFAKNIEKHFNKPKIAFSIGAPYLDPLFSIYHEMSVKLSDDETLYPGEKKQSEMKISTLQREMVNDYLQARPDLVADIHEYKNAYADDKEFEKTMQYTNGDELVVFYKASKSILSADTANSDLTRVEVFHKDSTSKKFTRKDKESSAFILTSKNIQIAYLYDQKNKSESITGDYLKLDKDGVPIKGMTVSIDTTINEASAKTVAEHEKRFLKEFRNNIANPNFKGDDGAFYRVVIERNKELNEKKLLPGVSKSQPK